MFQKPGLAYFEPIWVLFFTKFLLGTYLMELVFLCERLHLLSFSSFLLNLLSLLNL
jgi:hypothetical protein